MQIIDSCLEYKTDHSQGEEAYGAEMWKTATSQQDSKGFDSNQSEAVNNILTCMFNLGYFYFKTDLHQTGDFKQTG